MKKATPPERKKNQTLAGLYQDDPHLSPTMKARQMHEKLAGDSYEEKYLQELISLADEGIAPPAGSEASSLANDDTTVQKEVSLEVLRRLPSGDLQRKAIR